VNAYPWLFPGGIGDLYDEERGSVKDLNGPVKDLRSWARHLTQYCDGRFSSDQLFTLYVFNVIQRHDNNTDGNFFFKDDKWLGSNPPTLEELKDQIRAGNFSYVSKLRYFSQKIKGSDGFWRNKTHELQAWIDFHVSRQHGPPTHFITLTCAENWWPDLRKIFADLERSREKMMAIDSSDATTSRRRKKRKKAVKNGTGLHEAEEKTESQLLDECDFHAMTRAVRRYPLYVNQYFMKRAKIFLDIFARDVMDLEYYWGRVEFASGRGQIHLHILGIAKGKAYLTNFYNAKKESEKIQVIEDYAVRVLDMTADVDLDESHTKLDDLHVTTSSPLGRHYSECSNLHEDHIHLVQDSMLHQCNDYCLGPQDKDKKTHRNCRFGFGLETTPNEGDTPGRTNSYESTIEMDHKGIEHFLLPRRHSQRIVQHSKTLLQSWRANADIQLLIYRSNPAIPDIGEIEAVSRYCVAYAGKRYKSTKQEIDMIQDVILR